MYMLKKEVVEEQMIYTDFLLITKGKMDFHNGVVIILANLLNLESLIVRQSDMPQ